MSDRAASQVSAPIAVGDVLAGKYRIESVLGEGGMGYVLGARSLALDEPVAIKILKPSAVVDAEAVARFLREARAAVRMKGEHIAKVLDVGALEDGTPYMLMELLQGADLATLVERDGTFSVATAVDYILQTCEALAEAHALGIVHRDIKPSNLFLTTGIEGLPCLKVLDFGIAKATNAIDATRPDYGLTQTQTVMGSPQYMAPEQMRSSRRVDGRTDIWGVATVMHELLTGAPPFAANSMPELFAMILQDQAPSLRDTRKDVPPALDAIVLRCLEKSPDARPADVLELAQLLMPFASAASADAANRVARVGSRVALTSAALIAQRESSRSLVAATGIAPGGSAPRLGLYTPQEATLSAPSSDALAALNFARSAPDLAHSKTRRGGARAPLRQRREKLVLVASALAPVLFVAVCTATFLSFRRPEATYARPRVEAPAPPTLAATSRPVLEAPPQSLADESRPEVQGALVAATAEDAKPVTRNAAARRPATRPSSNPRPLAPAKPGSAEAAETAPPKAAPTASSRYD